MGGSRTDGQTPQGEPRKAEGPTQGHTDRKQQRGPRPLLSNQQRRLWDPCPNPLPSLQSTDWPQGTSGPQILGPAHQLGCATVGESSPFSHQQGSPLPPKMTIPGHPGAPCVGSSGPRLRGVRLAAPPGGDGGVGGGVAQSKLQKLLCLLLVPIHPQIPSAPTEPTVAPSL